MLNWFSKQSIQNRLLILFSSLILLGAIGISAGVLAVSQLNTFISRGVERSETILAYANLENQLLQQELALYQFAETGNLAYLRQYSNLERTADYSLRLLLSKNPDELQAANLRRIAAELESLHRQADTLVNQTDPGRATVTSFASQQARAQSEQFAGLRQRLRDMAAYENTSLLGLITEIRNLATIILLGGTSILAGFVIFVVIASLLLDDLADPLLALTTSTVAYEKGNFQAKMLQRYTERTDELGQLANSLHNLINTIQKQKQSQDRLLASLSRFFPSTYLNLLQKESIEQIELGDHVAAEMAVLFSDIRSFTNISESMTPGQNFQLVNSYLTLVSPLVQEHSGVIVKFLGDGVMAVFPYRVEDAILAALAKLRRVAEHRQQFQQEHKAIIELGIGIHTGHLMVGMIGEKHRLQGDAFSDNVNLTARIESLTRFFKVSLIISAETLARLENPALFSIRPLGLVQVKGRNKPVSLFEVFDADPPHIHRAKQETQPAYEAGIKAYRTGQFEQAIQRFSEVLQDCPDDHPSKIFLENAKRYAAHGAPPGWEGIEIMESK